MTFLSTATSNGQWNNRRIGDDQPFTHSIASLSPAERGPILKALHPGIQQHTIEVGDDEVEAVKDAHIIESNLLVERLGIGPSRLILVQGWSMEACGGVGNCAIWVLDGSYRLLLDGITGNQITVSRSLHHSKPDVKIGGHISASQEDLTWYRFDGRRYRAIACAIKSRLSGSNKPSVEYGQCDPN